MATVSGFAHTLVRAELDDTSLRYVGMIQAASEQIAELLEELGLFARIEAGRYEPSLIDTDTLELVRASATRVGERAAAGGLGGTVQVDPVPVERSLAGLARCALRHGALEQVELTADGPSVWIAPVKPDVAPILLGEDLKDLGAAAGKRLVDALGGSVLFEDDRLHVLLPQSRPAR